MSERPTAPLSQRARLTAVGIGAVVGIGLVLSVVADLGVSEIALILLPMLVSAALAAGFYL